MSKTRAIFVLLFTSLIINSCVTEVVLEPFVLPNVLQTVVNRVEAFEEHDALFAASDRGLYLKFESGEAATYEVINYSLLSEIDWKTAEVFYNEVGQEYTVIDGANVIQANAQGIQTQVDETALKFEAYRDFAMAPDGMIYRIGYYDDIWDGNPNNFYSDYYIGLYSLESLNSTTLWRLIDTTAMTVSSRYLSSPWATFNDDGDLFITTNPTYRVTNIGPSTISFDSVKKSNTDFIYKSISEPHVVNDEIFGFDREVSSFYVVNWYMSTTFDSDVVNSDLLSQSCVYPSNSNGPAKIIDWNQEVVRMFVSLVENDLSGGNDYIGYIVTLNVKTGECYSEGIKANEYVRDAQALNDFDIDGNYGYLATSNGLIVADLETDSVFTYTRLLFDQSEFGNQ